MEKSKLNGIYCITNIITDKKYIGSTTITFKNRWWHHKNRLRCNKHKNIHLQNAWNKYGEERFIFSILEIVDDKNIILEKEQTWIDLYDFNKLYNINPNATGGTQFSEDIIKKRTNTNIKRYKILTDKYNQWKNKEISDDELTEKELNQFNNWKNLKPWNKGIKYKSTDHLKVPKKKKGDRTNLILTVRNKLPEIEIYDINNQYIRTFRSAKDIEEWSLTFENNLPIKSRFSTTRMGKPINLLQSVNINKSCKTGKPYKNLIFKFK